MTGENTKLCDFSNTKNNDFISTPIAPTTSAECYEINAALLNLVIKEQFSSSPNEDVASSLGRPEIWSFTTRFNKAALNFI